MANNENTSAILAGHIGTLRTAAQEIEKRLCSTPDIPAKTLVSDCKQMNEFINTMHLIVQIKSVVDGPSQIVQAPGIIKPLN